MPGNKRLGLISFAVLVEKVGRKQKYIGPDQLFDGVEDRRVCGKFPDKILLKVVVHQTHLSSFLADSGLQIVKSQPVIGDLRLIHHVNCADVAVAFVCLNLSRGKFHDALLGEIVTVD